MKILAKILLPLVGIAALGLSASTILTYRMSTTALEETNASLHKMAIATAIAELEAGLEFNVFNAISLAQTSLLQPYLAGTPKERSENAKAAKDRLLNMRNTYDYTMLGIIDAKGIMLEHTESSYVGQSSAHKPFFKEAMQGKVAVGNPTQYKGQVVYTVASPVYDVISQKILGVVFNVSSLADTMRERMYLGEKGYLLVAGNAGLVFIHNDPEKVLTQDLNVTEWGQAMLHSKSGEMLFEEDGTAKLAHYDTLAEAGWLAVAVADIEELRRPSRNIRDNAILFAIGIILCLGGLISFYISSILNALFKAVRYAEQVAAGVLDKDLDLEGKDHGWASTVLYKISDTLQSMTGKGNKRELANEEYLKEKRTMALFNRNDELGVLYKALQTMVHSMRSMVAKSEEGSKLKGEFLANMSHEIRTPLNAVIGMAYLYLEGDGDMRKKRDYVVKIQVAAKTLLGIINNILDVSKIEAGMFELDTTPFNLRDVGKQVAIIHQENAANKNVEFEFSYDETLPDYVLGDPVRLGQVLNNLVGNALKFTEKGAVKFSFSKVPCETVEVGEGIITDPEKIYVLLMVQDTGFGIPPDHLERLFTPFTQGDTSITRRFGGTGLGLTITKSIVALMGAKITVASTIGQGSAFSFILAFTPAAQAFESVLETGESAKNMDLTGKRILVAEDNKMNQLLMEELLQPTNAEIVIAENGLVAVKLAMAQKFDLILMDMQMPIMDGIQASREIRKFASYTDLPIIAVTANAMKEDREQSIATGLNDYVTKPIEPAQLMLILRSWLCNK